MTCSADFESQLVSASFSGANAPRRVLRLRVPGLCFHPALAHVFEPGCGACAHARPRDASARGAFAPGQFPCCVVGSRTAHADRPPWLRQLPAATER